MRGNCAAQPLVFHFVFWLVAITKLSNVEFSVLVCHPVRGVCGVSEPRLFVKS